MDWRQIEVKWGEMARRVQSQPSPHPANNPRALRPAEPATDASFGSPENAAPAAASPTAE